MDIIDRDRVPSARELRLFGLIPPVVLGVLGVVFGRLVGWPLAVALWVAALIVVVVYYSVPSTRWLLYRAWMRASFPLAWTVSNLLLVSVYYVVLTPLGLARRLVGDPMLRGFDAGAASYWQRRRRETDLKRYFRQY